MARYAKLVNGYASASGNLNTLVAGTVTGGTTLVMDQIEIGTLSAKLVVLAETNTLTISGLWQVSNDGSTWVDCLPSNGAALVALATGTAGADSAVTVCLPANDAVYGWRYARAAVKNGVATGATGDTYAISYAFSRA